MSNTIGEAVARWNTRATPAQPAGMREALEKCADYVRARHNANIGWWNDAYAWQTLEHVIKPALALPAERPAVAQAVPEPTAEQLAVLARYLESQSDRLTKALDNPSWTPRRSHVEGNRNAFVAAANTLDQALRAASPVSSTVREGGK